MPHLNEPGSYSVRTALEAAHTHSQMRNTQQPSSQFKFALVIEESDNLRNSVVTLLREYGWLVHGIRRAEQAVSILRHIPYGLIVFGSELPGMCAMELAQILRNSRKWGTMRFVVITNSKSRNVESQIVECGACLARRSMWEEDLSGLLVDCGETPNRYPIH
jgi:CheY-like chemotaxis protein